MGLTRRSPTVAIRFFGVMVVTLLAVAILLAIFARGVRMISDRAIETQTPTQQR